MTSPPPDEGHPLVIDLEGRSGGTEGEPRSRRRFRLRTAVAVVGVIGSVIAVSVLWSADDGPAVSSDVLTSRGRQLFAAQGCAACHSLDPGEMATGPSLGEARSWAGDRHPDLSAEEYLAESIRDPAAFISPAAHDGAPRGGGMPDLNVGEDEIEALVAFLLER